MKRTIQKSSLKHRALLFDRLERFVNMGDGPEAIGKFLRYAPGFLPHRYRYLRKPDIDLELAPPVLRAMRDDLRNVWQGRDPKGEGLSRLLGLSTGPPWGEIAKDTDPATTNLITLYHTAHFEPSRVVPNWQTGGFDYTPGSQLHEAVDALMRESWRAKLCAQCERYFIADKSRQRYCSVDCSVAAQHEVQLDYYHRRGKQRRKERSAKQRRKRGR